MRKRSTSESDSSSEDEPPQYVLPENIYVKKMEEIIEKRYFPDNKQMRSVLTGNPNVNATTKPGDITGRIAKTPTLAQLEQSDEKKCLSTSDLTLDEFLNTYMGEDNASYEKLAQKERLKQLEEYKHFYKHEGQLFLGGPPAKDGRLHIMSHNAWKYTAENALMFNPSGVEYTGEELLSSGGKLKPDIDPKATRIELTVDPSIEMKLNQIKKDKFKDRLKQGKLDIDGNFNCIQTPNVNPTIGVGGDNSLSTLVEYAQPDAEVPASPLMTWGHIDSTPCRLDSTVKKPMGEFSIAPISEREEIAYNLGSGISKNNANSIFKTPTATPRYSVKRSGKMTPSLLSPAARRLMENQKLSKTSILNSARKNNNSLKTPTPIMRGVITPRKSTKK